LPTWNELAFETLSSGRLPLKKAATAKKTSGEIPASIPWEWRWIDCGRRQSRCSFGGVWPPSASRLGGRKRLEPAEFSTSGLDEFTFARKISHVKRLLARRCRRWTFSKVPCQKSGFDASRAKALPRGHLRPNSGGDVDGRQSNALNGCIFWG